MDYKHDMIADRSLSGFFLANPVLESLTIDPIYCRMIGMFEFFTSAFRLKFLY